MISRTDPFCYCPSPLLSSFIQSCFKIPAVARTPPQPLSSWTVLLYTSHSPAAMEMYRFDSFFCFVCWHKSPLPKLVPPLCAFKKALGKTLLGQGPRRGMGRGNNEVALTSVACWSSGSRTEEQRSPPFTGPGLGLGVRAALGKVFMSTLEVNICGIKCSHSTAWITTNLPCFSVLHKSPGDTWLDNQP